MSDSLPPTVSGYLAACGASEAVSLGLRDQAGLLRVFRECAPDEKADPLSGESLSWAMAALDCLAVMDERLYEHYRGIMDLIRGLFFRASREALLSAREWDAPREKAIQAGLLPEDLFGSNPPRPHLGRLSESLWKKVGDRA